MSKLRSLSTAFWSDPFIEELSPSEKLLFIYLITNEKTNMLGIYESSIKKISFETGIPSNTITEALKKFEANGKVKYSNNYVILVNFMKHQNFNPNMMKSAIDVYNNLPNELKDNSINVDKSDHLKGFETLLKHFGMVRKVEVEYKLELEDEKEIEEKIEKIYNLYPSSCPIKKSSTGKNEKNKAAIKKLIKENSFQNIYDRLNQYIEGCKKDKVWMKNFATILNQLPELEEFIKVVESHITDDTMVYYTDEDSFNPNTIHKIRKVMFDKYLKEGKKVKFKQYEGI